MRPFLLLIAGWLLWTAAVPVSRAQSSSEAEPVRVIRLHGPRTLDVGDVGNYRARVSDASTRPIGFLWDFGDGIASEGTVVAHRYREAGSYTVMVVAYNAGGKDTMRTTVTVREPIEQPAPVTQPSANRASASASPPSASPAAPAPSARSPEPSPPKPSSRIARDSVRSKLFSHDPIQPATSGYTWVMASDLWKERIESLLLKYRLQGLRVELLTDVNGSGAKAYRIIAGHFSTVGEALIARSLLDPTRVRMHLHGFAPGGMARAVSSLPQALDRLDPQFAGWIDRLPQETTRGGDPDPPLYADTQKEDGPTEDTSSADPSSVGPLPTVTEVPEETRVEGEGGPGRLAETSPPGGGSPIAPWFSGSWGWLGAFLAGVVAALSTGAVLLALFTSGRLKAWTPPASTNSTPDAPAERTPATQQATANTAAASVAGSAPDTDELPVAASASREAERAGSGDLSVPPVLDAREKGADAAPLGFVDEWMETQTSPLGDGFSSSEPPSRDFSDAEAANEFEAWTLTPESEVKDDRGDETLSLDAPPEAEADDPRPEDKTADESVAAPEPKPLSSPGAPRAAGQRPASDPPPASESVSTHAEDASTSEAPAEDPLLARARAARQAALRQSALAPKAPSGQATQPLESRAQPTQSRTQPASDRSKPVRRRPGDGPLDRQQSVPPAIDRGTAPLNIAWPEDDELAAMPVEAFQIIAPEDVDGPLWPHPSTWVVPGSDWEDLEDL